MSTDRQAKLSYPFNPIRKSFNTFKKRKNKTTTATRNKERN